MSTATTTDKTGARTEEAADVITGARERIDALDDRIIGLVQERMAISAVIQEARIASGGRRVNLSREMDDPRPLQGRARQAGHLARDDTAGAVPRPRLRTASDSRLRRHRRAPHGIRVRHPCTTDVRCTHVRMSSHPYGA